MNKKVIIISPRRGGALNQHKLIVKKLSSEGFDVSHYYDFWSWLKTHFVYNGNTVILTSIPFLFRFGKKNFFLNIHGNYKKECGFKNPLAYLYGLNILWSERVVVPLDYLRKKLEISQDKCVVIQNMIELNKSLKSLGKDSVKIKLITVTDFQFKEKALGVLKIIKSLTTLGDIKELELNIYGTGSYYESIQRKSTSLKLPRNISVKFNGYNKEIPKRMRESDIFVYWSNLDVMPIVLLEAMQSGLPIITNNFPSFEEILDDSNFICQNEKEFGRKIKLLAKNEELRISIARNNIDYVKQFSPKIIISKWIKLMGQ